MPHLKLQHSNKHLDLGPSPSIPVTMNNPIFDPENLERLYSYTITIPVTPWNNSCLKHSYRLDASGKKNYPAELYIEDQRFETGILVLTKSNAKNYTFIFRSQGIELVAKLKQQRLRELSMVEHNGFNNQFNLVFGMSYLSSFPTDNQYYVVEINNTIVISPVPDGFQAFIDKLNELPNVICTLFSEDPPTTFFFRVQSEDPSIPLYFNENPFVDSFDILVDIQNGAFVIDEPGDELTTTLQHNAWQAHFTDVNFQSLTHRFPTLKFINDAYDGKVGQYKGYANYVHPLGFLPQNDRNENFNNVWTYNLIPFTFVKAVLDNIAEQYGFTISGDLPADEYFQKVLIGSNVTLDFVINEWLGGISLDHGWRNVYKHQYNLADHLPDITAYDLFQIIISGWGAHIAIRDGKIFLRTAETILAQPAINWTNKVSPNWQQSFADNKGLTVDFDRQSNDEDYGEPTRAVTIPGDDDVAELKHEVGFMIYDEYRGRDEVTVGASLARDFLVPQTKDQAHAPGYNEADTRILFTRWIANTNGSSGAQYPFATYSQYAFTGFVGGDPLYLSNSQGLYEKRLKRLLTLLRKGNTITIPVRLTMRDLIELKRWDNPRRHFFTEEGSVTVVIKSVKFKATGLGIEDAELTCVRE